jgi:hypothetical protein
LIAWRLKLAAPNSQLVEKVNAEGGFLQPDGTRIKLDVKDVMMSSWRRSGVRALLSCKSSVRGGRVGGTMGTAAP